MYNSWLQGPKLNTALPIVDLYNCFQDVGILGQGTLRSRCHYAAWLVIKHVTLDGPDRQFPADPIVFDASLLVGFDEKVRAETDAFERGVGVHARELGECGGSD